jgi:hypothetical protein
MKPLKIGQAVLCEYVAEGARGKHSLINVYTGDIRIKEMPATFPIGLYVEIIPQPAQPSRFEVEVLVDDKLQGKLVGEFGEFVENRSALIAVPQLPVTVTENGAIKIVVTAPGFKRTAAIEKQVTLDPAV